MWGRLSCSASGYHPGVGETERERWQRNFTELLQELRVVQTGNQILFAFLLTLPFTNRFDQTTTTQRNVYLATLVATAIATILIIAPVSHHRILFRKGAKPEVVRTTSRLASAGLVFVLAAMAGALYLAVAVTSGASPAMAITIAVVVFGAGVWYLIPLFLRIRRE